MGHRMGVLEVCSAEGIRRGSIGDPQGILGGSSQFSGDPTFFDKQIHWVYCIFKGDPVRPLAPCIILKACSTETGAPDKSILQLYQARRETFLKLYQALLLKVAPFLKLYQALLLKVAPDQCQAPLTTV
jgi:hypothetical protein